MKMSIAGKCILGYTKDVLGWQQVLLAMVPANLFLLYAAVLLPKG